MQKLVFVVQLRRDMPREEALRYWKEVHGPIASKVPGLRKYVQNHASAALQGDLQFDGVAELWFDSPQSFQAATATPEWQAQLEDAAKFLDVERLWAALTDEIPIV